MSGKMDPGPRTHDGISIFQWNTKKKMSSIFQCIYLVFFSEHVRVFSELKIPEPIINNTLFSPAKAPVWSAPTRGKTTPLGTAVNTAYRSFYKNGRFHLAQSVRRVSEKFGNGHHTENRDTDIHNSIIWSGCSVHVYSVKYLIAAHYIISLFTGHNKTIIVERPLPNFINTLYALKLNMCTQTDSHAYPAQQ